MRKKVMMRRVGRDGTFCFHGKTYMAERPGFIGEWIVIHYDLQSGVVQFVESESAGESSVHPVEFESL